MSEWKEYRLSELGVLQRGKSRHRPRYAFHLYGGPYPFIQTGEVKAASKYINSFTQTYSEDGLAQSRLWPKDTLCITIAANIADIAILGFDACFPDSILGFTPNKDLCDINFVFYILKHFQKEIQSQAIGTVQDNINLGTFEILKFPFPTLPEQQAIAEVLSSLDDKIDLLHRNNKTLEQLAETLFRQWFVEEAKEDWEEKPLDQLGEFLNGLALQKFPYNGTGEYLNVIKIKEMNGGISENTDKCNAEIPPKYVVNDGDILFSWSGSLELMFWSGGKGALNQHLFKVTSDIYPDWLLYFAILQHLQFFRDVAQDKATTMGHIQRKHLTLATIKIPDEVSLEKMNNIITPLIDKLKHNQKNIKKLQTLRDTLIPKLMSGEVRVNLH